MTMAGQPLPDVVQPGIAIVVAERLTGAILAMLDGGCRLSASTNGTRKRCASAEPTVDLPEPETPITTTGDDARGPRSMCRWLRFHSTQPTPVRPSAVVTLPRRGGTG